MILTGVTVAQAIIPECHPVLCVVVPVFEELSYQPLALVDPDILNEGLHLLSCRKKPKHIQKHPPCKHPILDRRDLRDIILPVVM